eukprot:766329-Hanusia_phi.AAC.1
MIIESTPSWHVPAELNSYPTSLLLNSDRPSPVILSLVPDASAHGANLPLSLPFLVPPPPLLVPRRLPSPGPAISAACHCYGRAGAITPTSTGTSVYPNWGGMMTGGFIVAVIIITQPRK